MSKYAKALLYTFLLGVMLPMVVIGVAAGKLEAPVQPAPTITEPIAPTTDCSDDEMIQVLISENVVHGMTMEEYLVRVLLGELPADFSLAAKQAQAVAARTYALRTLGGDKHDGMICADAACCQSYRTAEDHLAQGGGESAVEQAREAVTSTAGQVLTYGGELIEATYFSCSGGRTEDSMAVWGSDVPYLQSVESPGEEEAAHYTDTLSFTAAEFSKALGRELYGSPDRWFAQIRRTAGGGVDQMTICEQTYSGTALRSLLGLRSTAFSVTVENDMIIITTKGFGHRVGMSQYGAEAMAVQGSSYEEILAHYYPGTGLQTWCTD